MPKQKSRLGRPPIGNTKIRLAYKNMKDRCYNPKNASFRHYGGRGIEVCQEWVNSRDSFIEWALKTGGETKGLSLDRINNNGNYSPENCRWTTMKEQLSNKRTNQLVTNNGETKTISEWERNLNLKPTTLRRRLLKYNIPIEKALISGRLNPWRHGTRAGYESHKCKCILCTASNTERHRKRREKKRCSAIS
jgi:hypothetical protein